MTMFIDKAAGLVSQLGQKAKALVQRVNPLDDPAVWFKEPMYSPPADIDIKAEQRWIDDLMGTTRGNRSIYKLVWNGDRDHWYEFFDQWHGNGKPIGNPRKRPRVRFKAIRGMQSRLLIKDVFPPRWLILSRLEPEQYAEHWARESWVIAPEINGMKLIRPEEPPPVFWLPYATIAEHSDFCCATKAKDGKRCFGRYAPPKAARELLERQAEADRKVLRPVFSDLTAEDIGAFENLSSGYAQELADLEIESEVYIENPGALLGMPGLMIEGMTPQKARERVERFFHKELQEAADRVEKAKRGE